MQRKPIFVCGGINQDADFWQIRKISGTGLEGCAMFKFRKQILEEKIAGLEKEISEQRAAHESVNKELEKKLSEERAAHESDNKELEELKSRIELEERTFGEIRDAMQKRLSEIEERSRQYDIEEKVKRENLQKEIEEKRKAAEQEIGRYQAEQAEIVKKRVQEFSRQYHLFFSKIHQASEILNNTALEIGNTFLENDRNIPELFQDQTKGFLDGLAPEKEQISLNCAPMGEPPKTVSAPEREQPKEGAAPEREGTKVNVVPFMSREEAPAEKMSQDM